MVRARQIGWSDKEIILWRISKQLDYLTDVLSKNVVYQTTTTTTTQGLDGELLVSETNEIITTNENNESITINEI